MCVYGRTDDGQTKDGPLSYKLPWSLRPKWTKNKMSSATILFRALRVSTWDYMKQKKKKKKKKKKIGRNSKLSISTK